MYARVLREASNQNGNIQRAEIEDMDSYTQSMKDSQIDSNTTFLMLLLK